MESNFTIKNVFYYVTLQTFQPSIESFTIFRVKNVPSFITTHQTIEELTHVHMFQLRNDFLREGYNTTEC